MEPRDISGSCAPDRGVSLLGAACAELQQHIVRSDAFHTRGFGRDERLEVDKVENRRLN
ncbi:hypothetical protein D3C85_1833530 [compost metagenome]